MKKRSLLLLSAVFILTLIMTVNSAAADTFASTKSKKQDAFDCIKVKNTVYCRDSQKIFKVNLKTRKVKLLKKIDCGPMIKKGNYLYFATEYDYESSRVYRLNIKTGKGKYLTKPLSLVDFTVKGKRLYYRYTASSGKKKCKYIPLSGKKKPKAARYPGGGKYRKSNVKGYSINWPDPLTVDSTVPYNYYLKTPKGKILLETVSTGPYIG